ncbi:hypothetical protein [Kurthia sibirica]|uniref:Uncharacterized protein n=1 Tax=Kurthia sibirica TaxID=202750 RepID=A0A2U3AR47_9BACL|nr:hypothetical protein [Kurthia sibirica]PWI27030.1 hypothetical protein DEX24_01685 [Kurthia sibirica]GEK35318.1 hypothetical protein KSI01_28510 [Kurthia sibirica]
MRSILFGATQITLFIICGAAYAELASHFAPLYSLDTTVREIAFFSITIISSFFSVLLINNVFGLSSK